MFFFLEKKPKSEIWFFFSYKFEFFLKKKNQIQIWFFFLRKKNQISDLVFFFQKKKPNLEEKKKPKKKLSFFFGFFFAHGRTYSQVMLYCMHQSPFYIPLCIESTHFLAFYKKRNFRILLLLHSPLYIH